MEPLVSGVSGVLAGIERLVSLLMTYGPPILTGWLLWRALRFSNKVQKDAATAGQPVASGAWKGVRDQFLTAGLTAVAIPVAWLLRDDVRNAVTSFVKPVVISIFGGG